MGIRGDAGPRMETIDGSSLACLRLGPAAVICRLTVALPGPPTGSPEAFSACRIKINKLSVHSPSSWSWRSWPS